ncbi:NF-kappa-B-repressing factor [Dendroctonus ponderosae]|uniref:G-patch domain-containing protein n=1 Tax=Dendroctonus ponderosae TaxID=77166 RepID=A0AAR5PEJ8_DENPD|nr:NF-kappa-B-repressing factor [Dendroctonus ponderosae]KAH1013594.1 hypothetical protein HUJ04_002568 [Dendroctonus ponderosae]
MDNNRYNQAQNYRRNFPRNPYDREPPQRGSGHYRHSNRGRDTSNRNYPNRFPNKDRWQPPQRTFDDHGREVFHNRVRKEQQSRPNPNAVEPTVAPPQLTAIEEKAKKFLQTAFSQNGVRSKLIFLENINDPLQTIHGTVSNCQLQLTVVQNCPGEFTLSIDKEEIAKGNFPTLAIAKKALAEQALDILKKDCFYITKKKEYEEVSTNDKKAEQQSHPESKLEGSKAYQMMLKMGWSGKGLGLNEQGAEKTVAETLDQNISRQGLGLDDVFKKIHKVLEDYAKSPKMSLLRFDADFTSEERAHIHKIAQKFGLKSKSEGKGEQRRLTVTKKLHRGDLVYNLLTCGLENDLYKLSIPPHFQHLWQDADEDEDEDDTYQPQFSS